MLDWFIQPPFFAPSDQAALASLAETINGESKHAVVQAPHHFEIWRLGEVSEETGELKASKEFLADCSSLIRRDLRETAPATGRDNPPGAPAIRSPNPPERTSGTTGALASALSGKAPGKAPEGNIEHPGN